MHRQDATSGPLIAIRGYPLHFEKRLIIYSGVGEKFSGRCLQAAIH